MALNQSETPDETQPDPAQEQGPEAEPETPAAPEGDRICWERRPGRMVVYREPLEADAAEGEPASPDAGPTRDEIDVDTIEQGIKAVFKLARDFPVEQTEDAHMTAAYGGPQGADKQYGGA